MELPDDYITKFVKPKPHAPRSEWEETLDSFYYKVNTPASVKKYGEFTRSRIGKALKGKSQLEIQTLFKECSKARSFGAYFQWKVKALSTPPGSTSPNPHD